MRLIIIINIFHINDYRWRVFWIRDRVWRSGSIFAIMAIDYAIGRMRINNQLIVCTRSRSLLDNEDDCDFFLCFNFENSRT